MWRVKSGMDRDIKRAYIKDLCLQTAPPTMRKTYGVLLISDRGANKDTPEISRSNSDSNHAETRKFHARAFPCGPMTYVDAPASTQFFFGKLPPGLMSHE